MILASRRGVLLYWSLEHNWRPEELRGFQPSCLLAGTGLVGVGLDSRPAPTDSAFAGLLDLLWYHASGKNQPRMELSLGTLILS